MDRDGSYRRFGANDSFPSSRAPNNNLSRVVVSSAKLSRHERNVEKREANPYADKSHKSTDFGNNTNIALGGFLSGVNTPLGNQQYLSGSTYRGGSFFSDFGKGFMSVINPVASIASKVAPFVI